MSTSKRVGPAARKNKGDTRERPRHESAPQTHVRVDLGRYATYDEARIALDYDLPINMSEPGTYQIRKRANGFHVYRRDLIRGM